MLSFLSRDPKRSAEEALLAGDRARAMELFTRSGEWRRAAELAAELADDEKLVRFSLTAALGKPPQGRLPDPLAAAEMLASRGHSTDAILLFERGGALLQAGEAARAAGEPLRAARYFRQAGDWLEAARCFEAEGKLREALQVVEEGLRNLERTVGGSLGGRERIEELDLVRADLLLRTGRVDSAVNLLCSMPPSARAIELLVREGRHAEAIQRYIERGQIEEASHLASRAPNPERLQAQILLGTGRPAEAGHLLAQLGLAREAAEAYEKAQDWSRAAYRWEAAGEPRRAAEAYEKANRPRDAARCYTAAGMPLRASEASARATGSGATKTPASGVRSSPTLETVRSHLMTGDKARAASLLLRMRPEETDFGEGAVLLAPLLIEEGFGEDALRHLRRVPPGGAPQVEIERRYWESRCLEAMGQTEAAIAGFERVLASEPGHGGARQRLAKLRPATEAAPAEGRVAATDGLPTMGGRLAGRYQIIAVLGRGGMGRVYKARDLELDEIVALKTLVTPEDDNAAEQERLLREVQICRRISHPNVVRAHDIGRFPGGLFITMEYIEGRDLPKVIAEESPLPFARIRFLLSEIAAGLHEAHSQGIIHRDLKPGNIMITASRLKILDFGIAAMAGLGSRLTRTGFVMGTPMYMSPDQILGRELDGRSDLYSLGLIVYTLISGQEPYPLIEPTALIFKQLQEAPADIRQLRPETPEPWAALLDRLLAKDPQDRFPSAQEVLDALAELPV